jgi:hypothetical protein
MTADLFLQSELLPSGVSSQSAANWNVRVTNTTTGAFLNWAPDGDTSTAYLNGIAATEIADPFTLNTSITQLSPGMSTVSNGPGLFQLSFTLAPGTYELSLSHRSRAVALADVPEPVAACVWGILACLGGAGYWKYRAS